eukprot:10856650-Lingulodinium_polyedra.AAC.1
MLRSRSRAARFRQETRQSRTRERLALQGRWGMPRSAGPVGNASLCRAGGECLALQGRRAERHDAPGT